LTGWRASEGAQVSGPALGKDAGLADVAAWLRLIATPGLSAAAARRLLGAFGLPSAVLAQPAARLHGLVPPAIAQILTAPPDATLAALIARTEAWLAVPNHHLVTLADSDYPARLLDLADPPLLLHVNGRRDALAAPSIGIVGARKATVQGAKDAHAFAAALSGAGFTVVSGLALGIDAAAHAGAMSGAGGTIAVIGTGIDVVYPARHHALAHEIVDRGGAILSEFPLGTPPVSHHFPKRNRLIAALGQGVLVVEAAERSGSLITARLASELGREVFAIPGSIHAPLSKGCHRLIRQGAKLVESLEDIVEEFPDLAPSSARPAGAEVADPRPTPADAFGAALAYDPVTLDALCACSGMSADAASAALLQLELAGAVERLPGNRYRRLG
jgi:DNA processing protein